MAKVKKKKAPPKEYIPSGMKREDYADATFRKKVTIIMGCILLAFVIGLVSLITYAWWDSNSFIREQNSILTALEEAKTDEDRAKVKIDVNDDDYVEWVSELDRTYNMASDEEGYGIYDGAAIHIQGMIKTKVFGEGKYQTIQYWLCRNSVHSHEEHHEDETPEEHLQEIPIEIIYANPKQEIPEDGTWVDVTGYVGVASTGSLSAVVDAEMTIMETPGVEVVE